MCKSEYVQSLIFYNQIGAVVEQGFGIDWFLMWSTYGHQETAGRYEFPAASKEPESFDCDFEGVCLAHVPVNLAVEFREARRKLGELLDDVLLTLEFLQILKLQRSPAKPYVDRRQ